MKTEQMADLLDDLVSFLERCASKAALNDVRSVGATLRAFPGDTVSSFCKFVEEAKNGRASRTRTQSNVDESIVAAMLAKVNNFLDNRRLMDYSDIELLIAAFDQLKLAEIRAVGQKLQGPVTPRSKAAMLNAWRNWLRSIKLSDEESSSRFAGAAAGS